MGRRFRTRFSPAFRARSLNTAGHSARRLEDLGSALDLYGDARKLAADETSLREAVIGEILTSLELGSAERETLLARLPADDGLGVNRLRRVTVEGQIALWLGGLQAAITTSNAVASLVSQVEDPLALDRVSPYACVSARRVGALSSGPRDMRRFGGGGQGISH